MKAQKPKANRGQAAEARSKRFPASAVGVLFVAVVGVGLWLSRSHPSATSNDPLSAQTNLPEGTAASVAPTTDSRFQKLVGRWLRPDGDYILEISSVEAGGKLAAAYLNPRPINVARAQALQDGTDIKVFVELRDVNYPGSTYTLMYDPPSDQLRGVYFQAALQQQYDVFFVRSK